MKEFSRNHGFLVVAQEEMGVLLRRGREDITDEELAARLQVLAKALFRSQKHLTNQTGQRNYAELVLG